MALSVTWLDFMFLKRKQYIQSHRPGKGFHFSRYIFPNDSIVPFMGSAIGGQDSNPSNDGFCHNDPFLFVSFWVFCLQKVGSWSRFVCQIFVQYISKYTLQC